MRKENINKGRLTRFLPYYRKHGLALFFDLFCTSLTTICALVFPMIVRELTTIATTDLASLTIAFVLKLTGLYMFLRIVDVFAGFYMSCYGHVMGSKIETDMRSDLFNHLQKLPFSFYDEAKIGQLMSRLTSDLFDVTEFAHHAPEELLVAGVKIIGSFIILCTVNVPLTLIMFSVLPFMMLFASMFNKKVRKNFRDQRVQVGEINSQVEDSLLGVRVVKSFGAETVEIEKFSKGNNKFLNIKKRTYAFLGGFEASNKFFDAVMYTLVLFFGSIYMMKGSIIIADFTAYLLYVSTLIESIRKIVQFTEQFQKGMTGIDRFFEIMDIDPVIVDKEDADKLENVRGDIEFKDVTFTYGDVNREVLSKLNLKVKAGDNVALVGPSGGGKTTFCNLIPRFYDVTDGSILVDGQDIKDVTLKSLRDEIGFVQQDVYLFSGTVFDNIEYGKKGATYDEVMEAAKLAGADEFISQLKNGYDTYVGERGIKLSGGQKQRISIARAFLKNPPILILDEATSALDNESERIVQQSLERLSKGRTTFTIAHRLTTIKNAGTILVLTENGIEESGTHIDLMQQNGIYSNLYSSYAEMNA
ncbi:MAG: ABC transporter ATP-binding protein [Clostridia bacterium]